MILFMKICALWIWSFALWCHLGFKYQILPHSYLSSCVGSSKCEIIPIFVDGKGLVFAYDRNGYLGHIYWEPGSNKRRIILR